MMQNKNNSLLIFFLLLPAILLTNCNTKKPNIEQGKKVTIRLEPGKENPRNSEGDFIQLKNGKILFVYTHFTDGSGDYASAYLAGRYSSDKGESWTKKDIQILANEGSMNIMSVSLLRLDDGNIALFYLRKNSEKSCIPYMRISTDEAQTWGEAKQCIETDGYYVVNNDRVVQLSGKRIIFSASQHDSGAMGIVRTYYSDDNGKNWKKSQQVSNPDSIILQEPGIIELKSGKLMLFCRTGSGFQYFSFSDDRGETWSPIQKGNIRSPLSPASIERIPSTGDLLLVWNNNFEQKSNGGKRTPYNMAISKDEGKTWEKIKSIESDPRGWYCYTAIEFIDDNLLLGHCAGNTRIQSGLATTQIVKLSLDWIYADVTKAPYVAYSDSTGLVKLECDDKNTEIYYTLNGKMPNKENGLLYEKPIKISHITPLHMQAYGKNKTPSMIVSEQVGTAIWQQAQDVQMPLEQGIIYHYYETKIYRTEEIEGKPAVKNGTLSQFSISNAQTDHNFAFVFDGFIKVPKDDFYTFYLNSNDGSTLFIDGFKLIDNDGAHGSYERSTRISLREGMHKIRLKYFQIGGGKNLKLSWKTKEIPKQEISGKYLFY